MALITTGGQGVHKISVLYSEVFFLVQFYFKSKDFVFGFLHLLSLEFPFIIYISSIILLRITFKIHDTEHWLSLSIFCKISSYLDVSIH